MRVNAGKPKGMKKMITLALLVASLWAEPYTAKDYSYLIGMKGFGNQTLKYHFKLYEGYVKNTNLAMSIIDQYAKEGKMMTPQFGALQRRLGWEWDGMRLHELYFENLGGNGQPDSKSSLYKAIVDQFGSYEAWKKEYIATGLVRGIGWVVLYQDPRTKKLFNMWINEHALNHLAGGHPFLTMDVWEHAYYLDYGLDRAGYINAFFENIDWPVVEKRYNEVNP